MDYLELKSEMDNYKVEMSSAERSYKYFNGEKVDHLLYTLQLPEPALANIYGYTTYQMENDINVFKDIIGKRTKRLGIEGVNVRLSLRSIGGAVGSNLVFPEDGLDYIDDHILKDYDDFDKLEIPNPYDNKILTPLLERAKVLKQSYPEMAITTGVVGPFSTAVAIRPIESVLKDTRKDVKNLEKLLQFSVDASLKWIEVFTKEIGPGTASISDPVTCTDILSKEQFNKLSLPYLEKLISGLIEITGKKPSLHICGHTKGIWEDVGKLEISSFSVDNCEDIGDTAEALGDKMLVVGNVPPIEVFRYGTIDDVIEFVKSCIKKAGDSPKGYMLSSGCQVPIGTPIENMEAFVYAVRKYGAGARIGEMPEGTRDA
ncbi:hypothetical protein K8M07_05580 [Schnuerera sp. xch1]|uniref:uroporphyrinogen decarboxylase family protein n=1 Tax=Schnuerera sp. xch1 TaxID=2874283 RepID=UPI001CBC1608|nr:uroporphyrinogen decarboxylase family protein [Schnuerera sp. xch1]MBZ2174716.1 hypothetical protein [Schnuerera sp. xch1]